MRRALRMVAWTAGALAAGAVALAGLLVGAANTDWGRRLAERAVASWSGNEIVVAGLSGRFPDDLRLGHAEARDAEGAWLVMDDVALRWSPLRLARGEVAVALLRADRAELRRSPPSAPSKAGTEPFRLPVRVDVDRLEVGRLDLGAPIAGAAASVAVAGRARVVSLQDFRADLRADRIDAAGVYRLAVQLEPDALQAELVVDEPPQGLLSGLAGLPDLGALSLHLALAGPRQAEAMRLALAAGPLRASGRGRIDLVERRVDLDLVADAPAMAPRADLRWQGISLQARVHGPFTRPEASGTLRIDRLEAGGTQVGSLRADLEGDLGTVRLRTALGGLRIPGPKPDLFRSAPIEVRAEARLDDPARPVTFSVSHPLLSAEGHANTAGDISGAGTLSAPALAPFAAMAGIDLKGRATLAARVGVRDKATSIDVGGTVGVTGGVAPLPELIGNASIDASLALREGGVTVRHARLDGRALRVAASGTRKGGVLDLDWKAALPNLALLAPDAAGSLEGEGSLRGPEADFELRAEVTGTAGTHGFPRGPIRASARIRGLPGAPAGDVDARATIDGSPLLLAVALERSRDGTLRGMIERAEWKSARAEGDVILRTGEKLPEGRLAARIERLEELRPWLGEALAGSVTASVDLMQVAGHPVAKIRAEARNAATADARADHLTLAGAVEDPATRPVFALTLTAEGIATRGVTGDARVQAKGPREALALDASAVFHNVGDAEVHATATATLDATTRRLSVSVARAQWKGETLRLLAPARISFAEGLAVDRLRIGADEAELELAGRILPALDLTASLRNATPTLARAFAPDLRAEGKLSLDARLGGSVAEPRGTLRANASGLRFRTGPGEALPAVDVAVNATLEPGSARVEARASAGKDLRLNAAGRVPLSAAGALDVRAAGTIDAAIANPVLEVDGRRVKGRIDVDLRVGGTLASPHADGSLRLAAGELEDYALGAHLTRVEALIEAAGDTFRIERFEARAGPGTLSASGSMGLFVPGRPVEVKLSARNAQPLSTDLLTANMDFDIAVRGRSQERLDAAGTITVHRAEINIPKALPPSVAVLDVRKPGQKPPPRPVPAAVVALDVAVHAPRAVFVRGRGLDAEVGGDLQVGGTTASPRVDGALEMRRGTMDLAGFSLRFTSGKVGFSGTGLTQKIDPTLDFEAQTTSGNITAKLVVSGNADAPKIALSSTPQLPQDEILARLLFGSDVKQLTALQLAQLGAAVASLSGVGGEGLNPLRAVQKGLGLDRLAVGGAASGGTSVEAGRYVAEGVYVGAKQTTSGATQAQVQVDLGKHLKLQATLGTGGTVQGVITPENDPGSSIGLSYQFEY